MYYRTKPRRTPAEIATARLSRLAAVASARCMARATLDTLEAWRSLPDGGARAAQLRAMLAHGLADAVVQAEAAEEARRRQVQEVVEVLRAGVDAANGWAL